MGYAYVNFQNVGDAERAIDTMNFTDIDVKVNNETKSRPCRIMWSQRDPSLRKSGVGNVFVKNLPSTIDNKSLYDVFSVFGNILSCKVLPDEKGGSGRGYVHYESAESASDAIQKINGTTFDERVVTVMPFVKRNERASVANWTNLYCKNVPKEWNEEKLKEIFAPFGEIQNISIARDGSGASKGFGFINYVEHPCAQAAVDVLTANPIVTELNEQLIVNRFQSKNERSRELKTLYQQRREETMKSNQNKNLFVKNIADDATDAEFEAEFSKFGPIVRFKVVRDEKGGCRGFGYVLYDNAESATAAMNSLSGITFKGKPLSVHYHQNKEVRQAMLNNRNGFMSSNSGFYPGYNGSRGMPRGNGRPPRLNYPVPAYSLNMVPGQRRPMNNNGNASGRPMNGAGAGPRRGPPNGAPRNMNNNGAPRRAPAGMAPVARPAPQPSQPPVMPMPAQSMIIDSATLSNFDVQTQKNLIGERLFFLIQIHQPQRAGKITGMLLEMDNSELLNLLESPNALQAKIDEAMVVLDQHEAQIQH